MAEIADPVVRDYYRTDMRSRLGRLRRPDRLPWRPGERRSFHGPGVTQGVSFSPNFKAGYDITHRINAGLEYYGSLGPVTGFDPFRDEQQQIVPAFDLNLGADWEFNFGVGIGVTHSTDHLLAKMILGRRFGFGTDRAKRTGRDQKRQKKAPETPN